MRPYPHLGTHASIVVHHAALFMAVACVPAEPVGDGEVVHEVRPVTWFEDGWSYFDVSPNADRALFGARFGFTLIDLSPRAEPLPALRDGLDRVVWAAFAADGALLRSGVREGTEGWFDEVGRTASVSLPLDARPRWSFDGQRVAYTRQADSALFMEREERVVRVDVGGAVTGLSWSAEGDRVFALVVHDDGLSSLVQVDAETQSVITMRDGLDATPRFNAIAAAPSGDALFLTLPAASPPDPDSRHDPRADRDLDIYRLDTATGNLTAVVAEPGDDFFPMIVRGDLYWTHTEFRDDIVAVPVEGGEAEVVVEGGQIPSWSHDGTQLGFTYGGWRLADWALNLDVAVIDVDDAAVARSAPRPIIVGYHEDFTPAWSPDGRWMAYHSHRSDHPVASYGAPGATDDIYLLRATSEPTEEIRLTDFGHEVGVADWAPDSRRLLFDSWGPDGPPAHPWIATIDPESGKLMRVERLPVPDGFAGSLFGAWHPAADTVALVERIEGQRQAIWLLAVDGSSARRLIEFESSTYGGIDWTPDGQTIVFAGMAEGRMQLFAVASAGGRPRQLTNDGVSLIQPQVSPDGRWIAATRITRVKQLRRMPVP